MLPLAIGQAQGPAAQWLLAQYAAAQVSKEYLCLCCSDGALGAGRLTIDRPLMPQLSRGSGEPRMVCDPRGKEARRPHPWPR